MLRFSQKSILVSRFRRVSDSGRVGQEGVRVVISIARRWAEIGLFIAALAIVGCSDGTKDSSVPGPKEGARVTGVQKLFDEMPRPDLALVVTGQLDGFLEPCGCSKGQAGGLVRRYELIERLRSKGWPVAAIDLGGSIGERAVANIGLDQSRIKFQYMLKAMGLLKYDALALDPVDLKVGAEEALTIYRDDLGPTTKLVVSNIKASGAFATVVRPSAVVDVGGTRLGVTSVIDPGSVAKLDDPDVAKVFPLIEPAGQSLPLTLADLESRSEYQALLVQGPYELAKQLATANPGFDVVVAASDSLGARDRRPEIINGGKTRLVTVGRRGYNVGVFAFHRDRAPTYNLVPLNDLYDGPAVAMKALIQQDYRAALQSARVVERFPKAAAPGPPGAVYVGAKTCAKCHANTFQKWSTTKHSQAFTSLLHDPKPNVACDIECVTCHTTGFRYESGWRSETATPYLAGNQCENCHGPGSRHATEPDHPDFRRLIAVKTEPVRKALCIQCHDHDNSPDFDDARYWSQVIHNGLDEKTDPKRHQGIPLQGKGDR